MTRNAVKPETVTPQTAMPQTAMPEPQPCKVSVIIKALNEEKHIAATIESALRAVAPVGGEVVLADACSTDRTVAIAWTYPIRIVQFAHADERSCGAGPQLGYQHALGEFVYILDGDMQMQEGFLERALAFMKGHPDVAGVGGRVVEKNTESLEYLARNERPLAHQCPGSVDRLDGGGLYRRSAIESAGYFSNRNLHSYEELELAARLRAQGWALWRMPLDVASHYGHDAPPYQLLRRRWKTRYICGLGELLRAAIGQPHFWLVTRDLRELRIYLAVLGWWTVLLTMPLWPGPAEFKAAAFAVLAMAPVLLMTWRKRSARKGLYAVVSWCFHAAGLVRGLLTEPKPTRQGIQSRVIKEVRGDAARSSPPGSCPAAAGPPQPASSLIQPAS